MLADTHSRGDRQGKPDSWPMGSPRFATTQWTVVLAAGDAGGTRRDAALDTFCRAYWYPLYAFLRRRGETPDDSRDLVQEFFTRLIQKDWLSGIEKRDTRFSTFLLSIFQRFLVSEYRRSTAEKRGGHSPRIDLLQAESFFEAELLTNETPEQVFERRWALGVLDAALSRLREDCCLTGRARLFEKLSPFLSREPVAGEYEAVGQTLDLGTNAVAVAIHRLRRQLRESVRVEVAAGLRNPASIDEELRHLGQALR